MVSRVHLALYASSSSPCQQFGGSTQANSHSASVAASTFVHITHNSLSLSSILVYARKFTVPFSFRPHHFTTHDLFSSYLDHFILDFCASRLILMRFPAVLSPHHICKFIVPFLIYTSYSSKVSIHSADIILLHNKLISPSLPFLYPSPSFLFISIIFLLSLLICFTHSFLFHLLICIASIHLFIYISSVPLLSTSPLSIPISFLPPFIFLSFPSFISTSLCLPLSPSSPLCTLFIYSYTSSQNLPFTSISFISLIHSHPLHPFIHPHYLFSSSSSLFPLFFYFIHSIYSFIYLHPSMKLYSYLFLHVSLSFITLYSFCYSYYLSSLHLSLHLLPTPIDFYHSAYLLIK